VEAGEVTSEEHVKRICEEQRQSSLINEQGEKIDAIDATYKMWDRSILA